MSGTVVMKKSVIILHDVDGKIYFDAVQLLKDKERIEKLEFYETSIFKRIVKALLKRKKIKEEFLRGIKNFIFRLKLLSVKDKTIIFGTAPYDYRFILYSILLRKNKIIYHTSWPYWWGENVPYNNFLQRILFKILLKHTNYTYVCLTVPVATSFSEEIALYKKKDIHIIPHSVNLDNFQVQKPNEIKNKIKILYVGRMVKEKGVVEICDLIDMMDKNLFEFTLVGTGDQEDYIKTRIKNKENVRYLGHIADKTKLSQEFRDNHIFILPSKRINGWEELFGLVIIEAMASGLLVIATDHIGPKGIIQNNINGFLLKDKNIVQDFYNLINNLEREKVNEIRNNAILSVEKYNIEIVSKQWAKVLEV